MIGGPADLATGPITRSAVRVQAVRVQGPAARPGPDDPVLRWWRSGRRGPVPAPATGWLELVRAERAAGIRLARVVVLAPGRDEHQDLLLRWWLPQLAAAGERVSVVDAEDHAVPAGQDDFWLVDGNRAVHLDHDAAGGFTGTTVPDAGPARRRLARLRAVAEPFDGWRARTGEGRCRGVLGRAA